jgi:hypothetical protein
MDVRHHDDCPSRRSKSAMLQASTVLSSSSIDRWRCRASLRTRLDLEDIGSIALRELRRHAGHLMVGYVVRQPNQGCMSLRRR